MGGALNFGRRSLSILFFPHRWWTFALNRQVWWFTPIICTQVHFWYILGILVHFWYRMNPYKCRKFAYKCRKFAKKCRKFPYFSVCCIFFVFWHSCSQFYQAKIKGIPAWNKWLTRHDSKVNFHNMSKHVICLNFGRWMHYGRWICSAQNLGRLRQ